MTPKWYVIAQVSRECRIVAGPLEGEAAENKARNLARNPPDRMTFWLLQYEPEWRGPIVNRDSRT
jgi:hypothetical protein